MSNRWIALWVGLSVAMAIGCMVALFVQAAKYECIAIKEQGE